MQPAQPYAYCSMTHLSCHLSVLYLIFNVKLFSISFQLELVLIMSFLGGKKLPRIQNTFIEQAVTKASVHKAPFNCI